MSRKTKFTILIVDDSDLERENLKNILDPIYNVIIARTGRAGLKKANDDKPDMILLDIVMPQLSGFDVLSELKSSDVTRHIPVLCITGLNNDEDEEKGLFLGAVDYITKPYNQAIVKARIKTHVQISQQIRTIERLGMIDALTDVPNRRHFNYTMHVEWVRSIRRGFTFSMLYIDIDKFKQFNDTCGHPLGDELLQDIAKAIKATLKRSAYLPARLGGDEFAVLLPNTEIDVAIEIAEDICTSVSELTIYNEKGKPVGATVSIGVAAVKPEADDDMITLTSQADKALRKSKSEGGNRVSY